VTHGDAIEGSRERERERDDRAYAYSVASLPEGVRLRHRKACASRAGKRCSCQPYYEASVGLGLRGERRSKSFSTPREAREWRIRMLAASQRRRRAVASRDTLRDAAEAYVSGMSSGMIKNRSGDAYKPKVVRDYVSSLRLYVLPDLGGRRISDIRARVLQRLVERIAAAGMSPSTIRNAINPVRAIYRRAVQLGEVPDDPTAAIVLPSVRSRRDRVAEPAEASRLLDAVPDTDRVVWALGLYAGLRRGEIMALRWCDVDFSKREIRVERGWDDKVGAIEPKSRSARRSVPMAERLAVMLRTQRERCAWAGDGDGLVSGRSPVAPFGPTGLHGRARRAWRGAGLHSIGLHEARHTFASTMIAAGIDAKELSQYMGHSSIATTLDLYGHLFPSSRLRAGQQLDAYLDAERSER
jgi:integrase